MQNKHIDQETGFAHGDQLVINCYWNRWGSLLNELCFFRAGPVPLTGSRRRRYVSHYRHNRFIGKRRWDEAHEEFGFVVRKKSKQYIPDPWDDVRREQHKTWKSYRKNQYKHMDT